MRRALPVALAALAIVPAPAADAADRVIVHGRTLEGARSAVQRAGLVRVTEFERFKAVVADGSPAAVRRVRRDRRVKLVERDRPLELHTSTSHRATRGIELAARTAAGGAPIDGRGVTIAVIDSGIDATHPFFADGDGRSAVVRQLKSICGGIGDNATCIRDLPAAGDSDSPSGGGHGTHVAGVAAGRPVVTLDGRQLRGAAPGAKLLTISIGGGLTYVNSHAAEEWILDHHQRPCGDDVSPDVCPPIRVVNNSYGGCGDDGIGNGEEAISALEDQLQSAMVKEGILPVWSAGNCAGDGSDGMTNFPAWRDFEGVVMVANYDDADSGTRDGAIAPDSSRAETGNFVTYPDVAAPGMYVESSCRLWLSTCQLTTRPPSSGPAPTDVATFSQISGTSMAAPHVAGIAAQLFQARPDATPAEVERALIHSATPVRGGTGWIDDPRGGRTAIDQGHGLVDAVGALDRLLAPVPVPPPAAAPAAAGPAPAVPAGPARAPRPRTRAAQRYTRCVKQAKRRRGAARRTAMARCTRLKPRVR